MPKQSKKYLDITVQARISTNQVDVRDFLDNLSLAAEFNAKLEDEGSPQRQTQIDIAAILSKASKDIDAANRKNWEK